MAIKDKEIICARLAYAIHSILEENSKSTKFNRIVSLRGLADAAGIEYPIVQLTASGKRNPSFGTIVALADGLGISVSEFTAHFDNVSEDTAIKWITERNIKPKKK